MSHDHGLNLSGIAPLAAVSLLLFTYLAAVGYQIQGGREWKLRRTVSFSVGTILLMVALLPSMHRFAYQDMRGHMIQHLLLGMLAPLGLVFGAPMTLALRTFPKKLSRSFVRVLHSRLVRGFSHPLVALLLNIGGMYLLYLTPLYKLSLEKSALHHLMHIHFLLAGYLFTWSIAGPDPAPRRPRFLTRLGVLFIAIAAHSVLSKYMYVFAFPHGTHHPPEQLLAAAKLMYYGGDLAELPLVIALFLIWHREETRKDERHV